MGEGDATADDLIEPPVQEAAAPQAKPARVASNGRGASGREQGSPEWVAWCKKHFPNSFDEASGTVKPFDGPRRTCPG